MIVYSALLAKGSVMDQQPNYRRRRAALFAAGLALFAVAQNHRPTFGTISIDFDADRAPRVDATLAPPLDAVVAAMVFAAEQLAR